MKVLFVTHCTDLSGANSSMLQLIQELRENHGVDPFVIYPKIYEKSGRTIEDVLIEKNIKGFSHPMIIFQRSKVGILHKLYFIIFGFIYLSHILFKLRRLNFDLVHSNSSVIDFGQYIALWKNIPHIWHFREVAAISFNYKSVLGVAYQKWIYHKSTKIIAISKNVREEFEGLIPLSKTIVVYNGIPVPTHVHLPNHDSEVVNICIVGRLEANKNQMEAVKALKLLVDDGIRNIKLFIVGNDKTPYGDGLRSFVRKNKLEDYCELTGVRSDVGDLMAGMNIGLMLSKHEAFGRVTVEYMMHGLSVIVSDTGANPEIVNNGVTGLVYSYGKDIELKNQLKELICDKEKRKMLSEKGREYAIKYFTSKQNSDSIFEIYKSL